MVKIRQASPAWAQAQTAKAQLRLASGHFDLFALAALGAIPGAVAAQQSPAPLAVSEAQPEDDRLADIVVTAQRRGENLQSVPIAITAFTAERLGAAGIASTQDLAIATPGLSIGNSQGNFQPRVRGIGSSVGGAGAENPVAVYVDGVYYAAAPASLLSLAGVERVEVLKGPQGTLFGRNATGGLIQIVTKAPGDRVEGQGSLSYDNYDTVTSDLYFSTPIATGLGFNVALHAARQGDGYGTNTATGRDVNRTTRDLAGRAKLAAAIGDLGLTLMGDYSELVGSYQAGRIPLGERSAVGGGTGQPTDRPWDVNVNTEPQRDFTGGGVSLRAELPLSFARLVSISAWRRSRLFSRFDFDLTPVPVLAIEFIQRDRQFSQEVQLASNPGSPITWTLGGYYFNARSVSDPQTVSFLAAAPGALGQLRTFGTQRTDSLSGFGQASVPLGDRTNLTGGLRYTSEKRVIDGFQEGTRVGGAAFTVSPRFNADRRYEKLTWRAAIDHRPAEGTLLYASYNRGFKSGGYNAQRPADRPFEPEVLDAFETGIKSDLLDRRLRLNLAGFYYDYANIQIPSYNNTGQVVIQNAAKARIYGLDLDATAVVGGGLQLNAGLSVLHDRFRSFPNAPFNQPLATGGSRQFSASATGNRLPFTPDWTLNLGGTYTVRLGGGSRLELDGNVLHSDGYFTEADNLRRQKAYQQANASLTWHDADDRVSVGAWARNLTNETVALQIVGAQLSGNAVFQPPRTYGATAGFKF